MRILVLGGTKFVGRSFVEEALARTHEVTLFNRGVTGPDLFPDVEKLRGDRGEDLSALEGRTWDAVFDPSCYVPRVARMSAEALKDAAPHYTFVSSLSAYADEAAVGQDEDAPLATIDDPTVEEVTGATYGALKVLAEREVQRVFGDRAVIVRPGFICGPYDDIDRMPYWLRRVERGGEVLAPEAPSFPVQLVDARDIARFALARAERSDGGVFNICAPQTPHRFGDLLETAARVVGQRDVTFTWASARFLLENGLHEWESLPWWVPPAEIAYSRFDASRALAAGFEPRPIEDSFRDCRAWDLTRADEPLRGDRGLAPEIEAELRIELAPAAEALERAGRRLTELLGSVPDPSAPTRGLRWTLGELTAHLAARMELLAGYLTGTAMPEGSTPEIAANSERQIRELRDVPFETNVELIAVSVAAFVETTRGRLADDPYPWYSGLTLDVATGTGVALAELIVHGYDVARTLGRSWPIEAEDARTIARASLTLAPEYVDPEATADRDVTYRVSIRGGPKVRVRIHDGTATLQESDGPADCTIRAEPVAFVLVSFGRMSRWRAAATGRLLAGGRRPWKALAFARAFVPP